MEMRAKEDIGIGEDLTPPLLPLASVLHDSAVGSYCSACFSTLPPQPFPPINPNFPTNCSRVHSCYSPTPLYCSPNCSSIDSSLHFSSAESRLLSLFRRSPPSVWEDSSDLRLSLRLIHVFQKNGNIESPESSEIIERIEGLMTNREKLIFEESRNSKSQIGDDAKNYTDENLSDCDDSDENTENVSKKIRVGAKMMAEARTTSMNYDVNLEKKREEFELEEMVLCLVLTNAVEVQDKSGCTIGIAVYDTAFSWINHSCSPNGCYRFVSGLEHHEQTPLRIASYATSGCVDGYGDIERNGYGPRVIVRSIKRVQKGDEVTIAYTDLLQPKEMRQAQLWLKYRFNCSCQRCGAVPTTYADYALQALSAACLDNPDSSSANKIEKLVQSFEDATNDYLSLGDAESCCKKLEHLIDESIKPKEAKSPQLHLFHHLSLNAYTTLASAYKVQAGDLLALNYDVEHKLEAFNLYKTSAAYSLLLAGAANHLFMSESSLVTTVANFWINAGGSLLNLATNSSMWDPNSTLKQGPIKMEFSSLLTRKCNDYCLADTSEPDSTMPLEEIKSRFFNCIANITPKVWSILASESSFLISIRNPIDFNWLASSETSMILPDDEARVARFVVKKISSSLEASECDDRVRMDLVRLSVHCLKHGAILSTICYGSSVEMYYYRTLEVLKDTRCY